MSLNGLIVDFETRSHANLKQEGTYRYATDPSTEAICCAFVDVGGDNGSWLWHNPHIYQINEQIWPDWVLDKLEDPAALIFAHNATFDRLIWEYVAEIDHNFPPILKPTSRWYCTSAMCRVNALPGSLENAALALNLKQKKDHNGARLIRECCIPPFCIESWTLAELAGYCRQDALVVEELIRECRPLTRDEWEDWKVNEAINERGVHIDVPLAKAAVKYAGNETAAIGGKLSVLSGGKITKHTQVQRGLQWVKHELKRAGVSDSVITRKRDGERKYCFDKAVRTELLDRADELNLDANTREIVQLIHEGNMSSVGKYAAMLSRADPEDERVRDAFVYAGASQTLRFSSKGLQLHNMRRDCVSAGDVERVRSVLLRSEALLRPMETLSRMLRPTLIPAEGKVFVVGDWSSIEAMGLPFLASTYGAEHKLQLFMEGVDVYEHTAKALGIDDRQIGKVAELSLGYGGSVGAFQNMARLYGVNIPHHTVSQIVQNWRSANMWAVNFWNSLETTAITAMRNPDKVFNATSQVGYCYSTKVMDGTLLGLLPGNTVIQYPYAKLERVKGGHSITAMKAAWGPPSGGQKTWPRVTLWRGLLAENVTQAFCAAILRHALRRLHEEPGPGDVVMDTHDEIVLEVDAELAYSAERRLHEVMNTPPSWAAGLPLKAKPVIMHRYGKA